MNRVTFEIGDYFSFGGGIGIVLNDEDRSALLLHGHNSLMYTFVKAPIPPDAEFILASNINPAAQVLFEGVRTMLDLNPVVGVKLTQPLTRIRRVSSHWKLRGFDTFSSELYTLPENYANEDQVLLAAGRMLSEMRRNQPDMADDELEDLIFIVRPDGSNYRYSE